MKKNKTKDPYPITDVYFLDMNAVDAATVTVGDLCERLSNDLNIGGGLGGEISDILPQLKKIKSKKYNSISFSNGADGGYSVWVGVDQNNKVRKIFAEANIADYMKQPENSKYYLSYSGDKIDMNDQFFSKPSGWSRKEHKNVKRIKLFNFTTSSGLICVHDHGGPLWFEHPEAISEALDEKYFKKKGIFQNNYPIGLFKFFYGVETKPSESTYKKSVIHNPEKEIAKPSANFSYTEFLSNLLDENCYPTKYIFEDYLEEFVGYREKTEIRIKEGVKISGKYLYKRLPKALEILNKQTKILFKENFKEVFEIRKSQFENFIHSIIKDVDPQELELPSFGKKKSENKLSKKIFRIEKVGLHYVLDALYEGYKLKEDSEFDIGAIVFPVKKGIYSMYLHCYSQPGEADEDYSLDYVKIVVEGLEDCYLNKNKKGKLVINKKFKDSMFVRNAIDNKLKSISIDKIDLRKSNSLKELEKLSFIKDLTMYGLDSITNWDPLSKLKNLKKLKFISCNVKSEVSNNFFKNLYSLKNLEEFEIDDSSLISLPPKGRFPKHLYLPKLKKFNIDFRKDWKEPKREDEYKNFQGYGNMDTYFLNIRLPAINNFPNFERFKSLEKLNLYNFFSDFSQHGHLFETKNYLDNFKKIGSIIRNFKKLKQIWIFGLNIMGDLENENKDIYQALEGLNQYKKVLINGKHIKKGKKKSKSSETIKKLELVCDIKKMDESKLISQNHDQIRLNYFANIEQDSDEKQISELFRNSLKSGLEEIKIISAYQFMYDIKTWRKHVWNQQVEELLKKIKSLKKIIFEFNEDVVDVGGNMDGEWSGSDYSAFAQLIDGWLNLYPKIEICVFHAQFKREIGKNSKFDKYFKLFNLFQVFQDNKKTKNRFKIMGFSTKEIYSLFAKYLREKINTIVIVEDNYGINSSKNLRDVEFLNKIDLKDFGNMETIRINAESKEIKPGYVGSKLYDKEERGFIKWLDKGLYEYSDKKYKHFANDRLDENDPYEGQIVLVKQNFLNKIKQKIFSNIEHIYYFALSGYYYDKYENEYENDFWKKAEYFKFPNSISLKKLKTLHIHKGRTVNLSYLAKKVGSSLTELILHKCIGKNKSFPRFSKLETLVINDNYCDPELKYSKFSNLTNIRNLEFRGLFNYDENLSRWTLSKFDFTDIYKLKNLRLLRLNELGSEFLPPLKTLVSLEDLEISLKIITTEMGPDDGIVNDNVIDRDFEFINSLNKLKNLKLTIPIDESSVKGVQLLKYVNKKIERLALDIRFFDAEFKIAYKIIDFITKNFKNLKELILILGRKDHFEIKENKKGNIIYLRSTGEKWCEGSGPRPFVLDLNKFRDFQKLEMLEFYEGDRDKMGFKIINPLSLTKMKSFKEVKIDDAKFSTKDLIKMKKITEKPINDFFKKCKKRNSYIKETWDLEGDDRDKYDLLNSKTIKFSDGYKVKWKIETVLEGRKDYKN